MLADMILLWLVCHDSGKPWTFICSLILWWFDWCYISSCKCIAMGIVLDLPAGLNQLQMKLKPKSLSHLATSCTTMQLTGCGQHKRPFPHTINKCFFKINIVWNYLYNMGNAMVIIYENSHRLLEQIVKGTQTMFLTDMHAQTQYAHWVGGEKSTPIFYLSKSQIQAKVMHSDILNLRVWLLKRVTGKNWEVKRW